MTPRSKYKKNTYIKSPGRSTAGMHRFGIRHGVQLVLVKMVAVHGDDGGGNVLVVVQSSADFLCESGLAGGRRATDSHPIGPRRR